MLRPDPNSCHQCSTGSTTLILHYSKECLDNAVRCLWRGRRSRYMDVVVTASLLLSCAYSVSARREVHPIAAIAVCAACVCLYWLVVVWSHGRSAHRLRVRCAQLSDSEMRVTLTEDVIIVSDRCSSSEFLWHDVTEARLSAEILLLFRRDNRFAMLPLSQIDKDSRAYLLGQLRGHGVPIRVC